MSKSYKKNPGHYPCSHYGGHRKKEKIAYNSKWRNKNKVSIYDDFEKLIFPKNHDDVIDKWSMAQDGDYVFNKEDVRFKRK